MNTNKDSVVKQSGNDVEGCRSQKVLFQPNMRVFLQYSENAFFFSEIAENVNITLILGAKHAKKTGP